MGDWAIGLVVFLGGFVIEEPAPYELLLMPVILVWIVFGLKLNRHFLPMIVLLLLYIAGGLMAITQLPSINKGAIYMATTAFLIFSSIFFAAVIATAPERRLELIKKAYIASAAITSLIGIAAYFRLLPGSDLFLLYGRVKGLFQDPNVFGPFLVLPIALLFRDVLTNRLRDSLGQSSLLMILLIAELLAFSRAAWGMTLVAMVLVTLLAFVNEPRQLGRVRILLYFVGGLMAAGVLIAIALSIPAVSDLFAQRATLLESYDSGRLGRFARQAMGFFLIQEHPLGLGPSAFGKLFGEDEHNMWLKGFTTYGWIGGFSYIILVVWTLVASAPLLFKRRAWTPIVQCAFATFLGQVMIHNVIDNDHWRHLFLLYGILWGVVAAEKMYARNLRRAASQRAPAGPATRRAPVSSKRPPLIPRGPVPAH